MVCFLAAVAVLAVCLLHVNVLFAMMCQLVCCNDRDRLFTRIKIDLTTYTNLLIKTLPLSASLPHSAVIAVAAVNAFALS